MQISDLHKCLYPTHHTKGYHSNLTCTQERFGPNHNTCSQHLEYEHYWNVEQLLVACKSQRTASVRQVMEGHVLINMTKGVNERVEMRYSHHL